MAEYLSSNKNNYINNNFTTFKDILRCFTLTGINYLIQMIVKYLCQSDTVTPMDLVTISIS